ncbi:hydantoinase/carbamoylase family amidase [Sulfobacillus harzensis]|uniref:Zn-dependent hydrolase n=1 Tax=Sulfobacillus harzensis TaxID=2729629 RepID=A0A7Y0L9T9_9FIRM|nr:Zn-dependent hydrolase [Sulfobacillus harzensis]
MTSPISSERLMQRIVEFAAIGRDPGGGITRPFGSDADFEARTAFHREVIEAGLEYQVDAAGNQWGRMPGHEASAKTIAAGSHLDTVPHGGAYDGAAGVLMSLEVLQSLAARGYRNRHPLAVVAFTGEEPNPFGLSTLGSRLYTGRLGSAQLMTHTSDNGRLLTEALRRVGGDLANCDSLDPDEIGAFIEPHIEQSGRLDAADLPIGVVDRITGIYRDHITLTGEQNHAGTTVLAHRRDALHAFSHAVLALNALLREPWPHWMVGTVGQVHVYPNAVNIVPSQVVFTVEIRSTDVDQLQHAAERYRQRLEQAMTSLSIAVTIRNILNQAPQPLSADLQRILVNAAQSRGVAPPILNSWAGHDATHMARRVPTGMLFIRSLAGKSHCPDEASRAPDLAMGAEILHDALIALDQTLEEVVTGVKAL